MANLIRHYISTGITVTGTWGSPQTILYADLIDANGASIPSTFDEYPGVKIVSKSLDVGVDLTEAPGLTSFKIARSDLGVIGGTLTVSIEITAAIPTGTEPEAGDAAWTLLDMMGMFWINLDDIGKRFFPPNLVVKILNGAQYRTIERLLNGVDERDTKRVNVQIIPALYTTEEELALTADAEYVLSGLTYEILDGISGIDRVKVTGGEVANMITPDEYREMLKEGFAFTSTKPLYVVHGGTLTLLAGDGSASMTIDISYCRKPVQMALAADPADNVNCELSDNLHEAIVGIAFENYRNRTNEALLAFDSATATIKDIRKRFRNSDSVRFAVLHGNPIDIIPSGRANIYTGV